MNARLFAVVLAVGAVSWHANGYAESLGRLFFTPDQRQRLDAGKRLQEEAAAAVAPPVRRGPTAVTLNGVVLRNDGQNTIWVNGHPTNDKSSGNITAVPTDDRTAARITVPGSATTKLRVGQRLDTSSGSIRENYAQRSRRVATGNPANIPRPDAQADEGSAEANGNSQSAGSAQQR